MSKVSQKKRIFIIAGEPSGDIIGGKIMNALQSAKKNLEFHGVGGTQMEYKGLNSIFPIRELSIIGFMEIVPKILKLRKLINKTVQEVLEYKPDLVITIDSPGFNFRVVKKLKNLHAKTKFLHIVAPSVWAYNPGRALKVAELYDKLLTLLPFEPPLFKKHGLDTEFIGHPIFEQNFRRNGTNFRRKHDISREAEVICVTLGSRTSEISRHIGVFTKALRLLQSRYEIFVVFPILSNDDSKLIRAKVGKSFKYVCVTGDERLDAYTAADIALAKSGSNTLEILACDTPVVVGYKVNFMTYIYIKLRILIKYVSLINIVADKAIIPEFIQDQCTPANLANSLSSYIKNDRLADIQVKEADKAMESMGFNSKSKPSENAASIIIKEFLL
jgi:lipid-A-disaccharide synthase